MSFAIVHFTPITVAVNRAKANIFERPSILFRPHNPSNERVFWWSRRVPPPGPIRLLHARLSPYSPKGRFIYKAHCAVVQEFSTPFGPIVEIFGSICIREAHVRNVHVDKNTQWFPAIANIERQKAFWCNCRLHIRDILVKYVNRIRAVSGKYIVLIIISSPA